MKINSLQLVGFRGATKPLTLEFDPPKNITMIFGENGNGKSTISDSLVCLCTDEHGSLDDKSSIDRDFYISTSSKPENVLIKLNTDAGVFSAKSPKNGTFIKNPTTGHPIVRHLRRSQITQLIEDQPAKRYEKLGSYIDVSNIAKSEDALRKAKKDADYDLKVAVSTLNNAMSTLEKAWKNEGSPMKSWEDWARTESEKDITAEAKRHALLEEVQKNWASISELKTKLENERKALSSANASQKDTEDKLKEAIKKDQNANEDLLNLLQSAKNYITGKDPITSCPVCNNVIEKTTIVNSLTEKINGMEAIKTLSLQVRKARQETDTRRSVCLSTVGSFHQKLTSIEKTIAVIKEPPYTALMNDLSLIKSENAEAEKINEFLAIYDKMGEMIIAQRQVVEKIKTAIVQNNLIKGQYQSIGESKIKAEKTDKVCKAMDAAIEIVENLRKEFVQNELLAISSDVNRLYQKIHPNEFLGGISLTLKKTTKNSLELNADFHGKKAITPQSVYSESHLDTLGICVFIALAKRYGSKNSILILDDVVMSVDENHLDRFIELLHDDCSDFSHILITTHYRPWRDRYRYNRAPSQKVHFLELRNWTLDGGIRVQNGRIACDELRTALTDTKYFDRQKITSSAGIILENLLDFLSTQYGCKVPRKPRNDYQLRELLDSISKKLMNALKVQHFNKDPAAKKYAPDSLSHETNLKDILDKIKGLAIVRNWVGAHYNYDGSLVSDKDVEEFGKLTLEFAELLTCPDSGQFPDKDKSGSHWETKTGSIRLHPLKEPS